MSEVNFDRLAKEWVEQVFEEQTPNTKRNFSVVISTTAKPDEKTVFIILPRYDNPSPTFSVSVNGIDLVAVFTLDQQEDEVNVNCMLNKGGVIELEENDIVAIAKEVMDKFPVR